MSAKAFQQMATVLQSFIHRETLWSPHGCPHESVPICRKKGGRPLITLNQTGGHDPDHPVMPMALSQQNERR